VNPFPGLGRPVLLVFPANPPKPGEGWNRYRRRIEERLTPVRRQVAAVTGVVLEPLVAANALHGWASDDQVSEIQGGRLGTEIELVDWGCEAYGEQADVSRGVELGEDSCIGGKHSGNGVTVAVLDSGIDARHTFLKVAGAVSTCPEPSGTPGWHGTHCAGVIASKSPRYPGIAPGVRLLDVKVARADGITSPGWLAQGIDAALDADADVLSISFGMNHFSSRTPNGHGWPCPEGRCLLCRAADHATACGAVVVAAAGNEHLRVQALHKDESSLPPNAELLCPGQAKSVLTVGAIEKAQTARLYPPSSRGFARPGVRKPDLVAPGVGIMSTVPLPEHGPPYSSLELYGLSSGTSVATAMVAGAVALLIERYRSTGVTWTPALIRRDLLSHCEAPVHDEELREAYGTGSLDLSTLLS